MTKKQLAFILLISFFSGQLFAATPVETHGAMKANGNQIVGSVDNEPVQVAGMSLYWSVWGGEKFYNTRVVDKLVTDWNITLIRAAMAVVANYASGYVDDSSGQAGMVRTIVDAAIQKGIYVIIDWHDHDANLHVEDAKRFFGNMARTYKNTPNIIWEIWNEPDNVGGTGLNGKDTWEDIRNYAAQVIPVIREHSSNLIVVGTPTWSQDVDIAAGQPLEYDNIAYSLHFYAGSHGQYLRDKAETALDAGVPLFITEFGLSHANGGSGAYAGIIYTDSTKAWLDWADSKKISWANWSLVDKGESSAALVPGASGDGNWAANNISASGTWIRNRLLERTVYEKPVIDTMALPPRLEAESYSRLSSDGIRSESTSDGGGGENLGYTKAGSWAEYEVSIREASTYIAFARVASGEGSQGGTLTLKSGDAVLASWTVGNTGGWQTWETTAPSQEFMLQPGIITLRVEWSGEGESLVNLNWIEFDKVTAIRRRNLESGLEAIRPMSGNGFVSLHVPENVRSIGVMTLSGKFVHRIPAKTGFIRLPVKNGVYLLHLEYKSGAVKTVPVTNF